METPKKTLKHRSKFGCQACRRRKRKCNEIHPTCNFCLERNLPCNWEREVTSTRKLARSKRKVNKDFVLPHEMTSLTTVFTAPIGSIVQRLVSHFSATSPFWLTVGGSRKVDTCLRLLMPALYRSPLVLNCVLAVSAGDMSKYQPASSDLTNLSYGFYGQAVAGIQSAINNELVSPQSSMLAGETEDDTLLAIILLCINEAVNFTNSDRMFPHLNAAALLCANRSFSAAKNPLLRGLLFEVFCYIFTLTAFSHGGNLQLPLALQVFNSPFLGSQYQGILIELSLELFHMILRISILISKIPPSSFLDPTARTELELIETQLYNWQHPKTSEDTEIKASNDERITSELYRLACLIHIKKILKPDLLLRSSEIQDLVLQFTTSLKVLSPKSPANGILCWPLVVAGMCATVGSHRRLILCRVRNNNQMWRSEIFNKSAELLCKQWREDTTSGGFQAWAMINPLGADIKNTSRLPEFPVILL